MVFLLTQNFVNNRNNSISNTTCKELKVWPIFINKNKLQKISNQLLPNDFEQLNFSIPKYHCHLSEIHSYHKYQTSVLKPWYNSRELLTDIKFNSSGFF